MGGGAPMRDQGGQVVSQLGRLPSRSPDYAFNQKLGTNSPSRKELYHMRPSNLFEDITEDRFNQRETEKHRYRLELER